MSKRITVLLAIMLCCLLGLLFMQGYLAYQEYQRRQGDLLDQVNRLFVQSVRVEKEARLDVLVDLFQKDLADPKLVRIEARPDPEAARTIFDLFDAASGNLEMSIAFDQLDLVTDTLTPEARRRFFERMQREVREDLAAEAVVYWTELLAERIKQNLRELPVDTAILRTTFRARLDSAGISASFGLQIDTAFAVTPSGAAGTELYTAAVPLYGQSWIGNQQARAVIANPGYTVFRRSLLTIAGSAAVILLTLLSFYLLFATILQQQKLSELKDDFIDNITHELQTPIAALRLAVDSLQHFQVQTNKERYDRYLQVAGTELNRLSELVDGILQQSVVSEAQTIEREQIDLMELIRSEADRHRLKAAKPVAIRLPEWERFTVNSSPFHLTTILDNLLQNAIRYSDEAGVKIDIRLERKAQGFVLAVADDGWGIDPADRRRIFEKFQRSSDQDRNYTVKGLGIGLYHVRRCVEALGGSIRVSANKPRGTVMEIVVVCIG